MGGKLFLLLIVASGPFIGPSGAGEQPDAGLITMACTSTLAIHSASGTCSQSPEDLLGSALLAGEYLLEHQKDNGMFDYLYDPLLDRNLVDYNLLRHAGTCYSLVLLYEVSRDARYLRAAHRGLDFLCRHLKEPRPEHQDRDFRALVTGDPPEGNLGGTALSILALVEYRLSTGDRSRDRLLEQMGQFLRFQQEDSGQFRHKYLYDSVKESTFESEYYPGEAILSLVRLYSIERDPSWLKTAEQGALWLIQQRDSQIDDSALNHDHWLLMALNELYAISRSSIFLDHGMRIARVIVESQRKEDQPSEWKGSWGDPPRCSPAATRAEGLVAAYFLALEGHRDKDQFLHPLKAAAAFIRRCQLTAGQVESLPNPEHALGGFRGSLEDWSIRIDYSQHAVCALLGLREILLEREEKSTATQGIRIPPQ